MATNIIYIVVRCQLHLRTAQQKQNGGKFKKPKFSWTEKTAQNNAFLQPEESGSTYEVVELEAADGSRWKTKLVHSTSCEEDVRIAGHSHIKEVALQHRMEEARKHIDELKKAEITVMGAPKSLWRKRDGCSLCLPTPSTSSFIPNYSLQTQKINPVFALLPNCPTSMLASPATTMAIINTPMFAS